MSIEIDKKCGIIFTKDTGLQFERGNPMATQRQKEEGMLRLQQLTEAFNLNPKLCKYLGEGRLYYSYWMADLFGCIDTIEWDERFPKLVKSFERRKGAYVYHVIESKMRFGHMLCFLYVSKEKYKEEWEYERLCEDYISCYTYNLDTGYEEYGDIFLMSDNGALLRRA